VLTLVAGASLLAACVATDDRPAPTDGEGSASASAASPSPSATATGPAAPTVIDLDREFSLLEAQYGARLGVVAFQSARAGAGTGTGTGASPLVAYRADERFAYASTVKALAVGILLQRTPPGDLDRVVPFTDADLVPHSPITSERVGAGMSLRELSDAALRYSDNTAGNLIVAELGGTAALDHALEGLGDTVTQVDRTEPDLNEAAPGDARDTSTPELSPATSTPWCSETPSSPSHAAC
jgi:beta-lactamase class A